MAFAYSENSATIGTTEYSLPANANYSSGSPQTDACYLQIWLDLNALISGDQYEMRIYEKVRSADTQRVVQTITFTGIQPEPIYVHPALHLRNAWDVTLDKLAGTDRSISWSLRKVA